MTAADVLSVYGALSAAGVTVWVDGGWCVDALVGRQTRQHDDLDLAVSRADEPALRAVLAGRGYAERPAPDSNAWQYVLGDPAARSVDVHAVGYDPAGRHVYGVAYPPGSLTGTGTIDGRPVRCVAPEWMYRFKTGYPPADKDRADVRALSAAYGLALPHGY